MLEKSYCLALWGRKCEGNEIQMCPTLCLLLTQRLPLLESDCSMTPPHPIQKSNPSSSCSIPFLLLFFGCTGSLLWYSGFSLWHMDLAVRIMWDLSFLTKDGTHVPCIWKWILNHWTTREIHSCCYKEIFRIQTMQGECPRHVNEGGWEESLPASSLARMSINPSSLIASWPVTIRDYAWLYSGGHLTSELHLPFRKWN